MSLLSRASGLGELELDDLPLVAFLAELNDDLSLGLAELGHAADDDLRTLAGVRVRVDADEGGVLKLAPALHRLARLLELGARHRGMARRRRGRHVPLAQIFD